MDGASTAIVSRVAGPVCASMNPQRSNSASAKNAAFVQRFGRHFGAMRDAPSESVNDSRHWRFGTPLLEAKKKRRREWAYSRPPAPCAGRSLAAATFMAPNVLLRSLNPLSARLAGDVVILQRGRRCAVQRAHAIRFGDLIG